MNYKSASVASIRFSQIKKKMDAALDGPGTSGFGTELTTPTKAPKGKANKVTKAAKTHTPRKGLAQPVKKGAKSTAAVTKEDDSEMDDKDDYNEDKELLATKKDEDDESYEMVEGGDEQVST